MNRTLLSTFKMATRWGICSAGLIAHDFCAALKTLPASEHQVVSVAARKIDDAKLFARNLGIPVAYGSYEELAKDPNVDIVYVATIHPYHLPASLLFLEHGKHLLVEKPITMTTAECRQLIEKAREKKCFLMEGLWTRFFPAFRAVREELKSGSLGQITFVKACFLSPARAVLKANNKKRCQGGALMARGSYPVNMAQVVLGGRPEKIVAIRQMFDEESGGDIGSTIILRYPGGATAVLYYNEDSADGSNTVTIHGTKGNLEIHNDMHTPTSITLPSGERRDFPLPDSGGTTFKWPDSIGFVFEAQCVRECLQKGLLECPEMTHEDSQQIMSILEETYRQLGMEYHPPK